MPIWLFVLMTQICGCSDKAALACNATMEAQQSMANAIHSLDSKMKFTPWPECAACPKQRLCSDDTAELAAGASAQREIQELHAIMRSFKNDSSFGYDQLVSRLQDLAGDE